MMEDHVEVRTRPATGAVLSVRVAREVASALDDYAAAHGLSLSEVVRVALDQMLGGLDPLLQGRGFTAANAAKLTITLPQASQEQRTRSVAELRTAYGDPSHAPLPSR